MIDEAGANQERTKAVAFARILALVTAWALLIPLLLIYLDCYGRAVPGEYALAIILFGPAVSLGALAPVLFSTVGFLVSGRPGALRGWSIAAFVALIVLVIHSYGMFVEFLIALIPIVPSVLLSGLAVIDWADLSIPEPDPTRRIESDAGHDELGLARIGRSRFSPK
ncbi:MAG: hypothetical protein AAB074_02720 [Planctomycetota bacterium]